ncbi:MAG: hypothetical protein CMO26_22330 [Thiotrichales bacterium]|nr:hypothetical protein [Thiotrichales bacterium]
MEPHQRLGPDTTLVLNWAGVRTKFFVDVYVCALYLPAPNLMQALFSTATTRLVCTSKCCTAPSQKNS